MCNVLNFDPLVLRDGDKQVVVQCSQLLMHELQHRDNLEITCQRTCIVNPIFQVCHTCIPVVFQSIDRKRVQTSQIVGLFERSVQQFECHSDSLWVDHTVLP